MIRGTKRWNDRDTLYIQTNNAVEEALNRYDSGESAVTCGPTAAVNCLAAMGIDVEVQTPGGWRLQPEDALMLWFHDRRQWEKLREIRGATDPANTPFSPNEIPQYYGEAISQVFGYAARFKWIKDFDQVADHVFKGRAVQVSKKKGHYIAVVAYDSDLDELIINDPYPVDYTNHNGFNRRMGRNEFSTDIRPYGIFYGGGK